MMLLTLGILFVWLACPGLAQQGPTAGFSPVPPWPGNGNLPPELAKESVFFDPTTNEIVVVIGEEGGSEAGNILRFELHNQAIPMVVAKVSPDTDGYYVYEYVVAAAAGSRRALAEWSLLIPGEAGRVSATPTGWDARIENTNMPDRNVPGPAILEYVHFTAQDRRELAPGAAISGLRLRSRYLPGYATSFAKSKANRPLTPQQLSLLPPTARQKLQSVLAPHWDHRAITVLSPRFAPDTPLQVVAAALHFSIQHLGRTGRRLDLNRPFAQSALSTLQSAIEQARETAFSETELGFLEGAETEAEKEVAQVVRISLTEAGK